MWWVEARDAAEDPAMRRMAPRPRTSAAQNVGSNEVEKPCYRGIWFVEKDSDVLPRITGCHRKMGLCQAKSKQTGGGLGDDGGGRGEGSAESTVRDTKDR